MLASLTNYGTKWGLSTRALGDVDESTGEVTDLQLCTIDAVVNPSIGELVSSNGDRFVNGILESKQFVCNIHGEVIEEKFKESPFILDMMVVGEGEKFAAAIIAPDFDMLQDWCPRHGVDAKTREEMVASKAVQERFQRVVDKYNSKLGNHEQVKRFQLVTDSWTTENQFLTPTLKIKRKNVASYYQNLIADLFK